MSNMRSALESGVSRGIESRAADTAGEILLFVLGVSIPRGVYESAVLSVTRDRSR